MPDPFAMCTMDYTPVCGKNGRTYSNRCAAEAACEVDAVEGRCEPPSWVAQSPPPPPPSPCVAHVGICTRDYRPRCGKNGITYSNPCMARNACQVDTTEGACNARHTSVPVPTHVPTAADPFRSASGEAPSPPHLSPEASPTSSSLSTLLSSLLVGGAPVVGGSGNALGGHYTGSSEQDLVEQDQVGGWAAETETGEASHVYHLVRAAMTGLQDLGAPGQLCDPHSATFATSCPAPQGDSQVRVRSARVQVVAGKNYQIEAELTPACNRASIAAELTPLACRLSVLSLQIYERVWSSTLRLKAATMQRVGHDPIHADFDLDLSGLAALDPEPAAATAVETAVETEATPAPEHTKAAPSAVLEEAEESDMPQESIEPPSALKASRLTRAALPASIVLVMAGVLFGVVSVVRVRAANRATTADLVALCVGSKSDAAAFAQAPMQIIRVELERKSAPL